MIQQSILQLLLVFLFVQTGSAQELVPENIAEFRIDGALVKDPFVGGLNAPQFSNVDFNNDGLIDVLIFDRIGNVIIPMLRSTDGLHFDPSYAANFPNVENFLLMKDYNADGIADIFCYSMEPGVHGVSIYKGKYTNNRINFDLYVDPDYNSKAVSYELANGTLSNLFVSDDDIPSIEDIDGDGDMDIVTFNSNGGHVEYFRNLVVEREESLDEFFFLKFDDCYGGMYESGQSEEIQLADAPGICANMLTNEEVVTRHAGSTVLSIDYDQDGDYELLLGDLSFNNITLLKNDGSTQEAWFSEQILKYPNEAAEAVEIPVFPGAFYADMDGDGVNDFIAAPNNRNNALDVDNVWYYRNSGENDLPELTLESKSLFGEDMIDIGTSAYPTFADVNADGLIDLVVGNLTTYVLTGGRDSRLHLFLNEGTSTAPIFNLVDDNWLDFQRFGLDAYNFTPTFADLDSDGDLDLFAGEIGGNIYYAENIGATGQAMEFGPIEPNYLNIDVGSESAPTFYDADKDGLLDLLVGEKNGNINFLRNIGTASVPNFNPDPAASENVEILGQIDTRIPGFISSGHSKPTVINTGDGAAIVTGTDHGNLEMYAMSTDLNSEFTLLNESLGDIEVGDYVTPAFADINNDDIYELIVGNRRGGLTGYRSDISSLPVSINEQLSTPKISLYSTLVRESIQVAGSLPAEMTVYSVLGQQLISKSMTRQLDVSLLTSGIYFVNLRRGEVQNTVKFVKQ